MAEWSIPELMNMGVKGSTFIDPLRRGYESPIKPNTPAPRTVDFSERRGALDRRRAQAVTERAEQIRATQNQRAWESAQAKAPTAQPVKPGATIYVNPAGEAGAANPAAVERLLGSQANKATVGALNQNVRTLNNTAGGPFSFRAALPTVEDAKNFARDKVYDVIDKTKLGGAGKVAGLARAGLKYGLPVIGGAMDINDTKNAIQRGDALGATYGAINTAADAAMLSGNPLALATGGAYNAGRGVGNIANWLINATGLGIDPNKGIDGKLSPEAIAATEGNIQARINRLKNSATAPANVDNNNGSDNSGRSGGETTTKQILDTPVTPSFMDTLKEQALANNIGAIPVPQEKPLRDLTSQEILDSRQYKFGEALDMADDAMARKGVLWTERATPKRMKENFDAAEKIMASGVINRKSILDRINDERTLPAAALKPYADMYGQRVIAEGSNKNHQLNAISSMYGSDKQFEGLKIPKALNPAEEKSFLAQASMYDADAALKRGQAANVGQDTAMRSMADFAEKAANAAKRPDGSIDMDSYNQLISDFTNQMQGNQRVETRGAIPKKDPALFGMIKGSPAQPAVKEWKKPAIVANDPNARYDVRTGRWYTQRDGQNYVVE